MKFEIKLNDDLKDFTITTDAQTISDLKYAVIVAKSRAETNLMEFEDNPKILDSVKKDYELFSELLDTIRNAY